MLSGDIYNNMYVQKFRKLDKSDTRRQKSGSVDSTPILAAKFKHTNRSARKGRWSVATPAAAQQVSRCDDVDVVDVVDVIVNSVIASVDLEMASISLALRIHCYNGTRPSFVQLV